jgi:putative PIN family toxin of toxin-antitoxin system
VKVGLDTNVVVSAVATRGLCADLLIVILAEHDLVLGATVLAELQQVLARKIGVPKDTIRDLDAFLRSQATIVPAGPVTAHASLEGPDAQVLGEAVAGGGAVLVTGDRGLLALRNPPVEIVSPRRLWERLRSSPKGSRRAT